MPWFVADLKILNTPYLDTIPEGVTPDLSLRSRKEPQRHPMWEANVTNFPSGASQRVSWQTQIRSSWQLDIEFLPDQNPDDLVTFFVMHSGILVPFKWYHNSYGVFTLRYVRFNQQSFDLRPEAPHIWLTQIELTEVHPSEIITE